MTFDEISLVITGYGEFRVTTEQMDRAISYYLPSSPYTLNNKIDAHPSNSHEPGYYSDLITLTEHLVVLIYLDTRPADKETTVYAV